MKKTLLILAGLTLGTAAIAQTVPTDSADPAASAPATAPADTTLPDPAAGTQTTSPPAPDAAMTTQSGSSMSTTGSSMQTPTATDTSNYPRCSRGMKDKCMQRGGR
jgi:uncharacterized protein involved in copper resistance